MTNNVEEKVHSRVLSPSSLARTLTCPGSVVATANLPDKQTIYSMEGTTAHELCAKKLEEALGMTNEVDVTSMPYYSEEMEDTAEGYKNFVLEKLAEIKEVCNDPIILIEQRVSAPNYHQELFGTADCVIVADKRMTVVDYKNGLGHKVDAERNYQMLGYALCCLETFGHLYDISEVEMCIYQPRIHNISEWQCSVEEVYKWADEILKPGIEKIEAKVEEFNPSEHCTFCKIRYRCKALRDQNLEIAKKEFMPAYLMDDSDIEDVLNKADGIISWLNAIKDFALEEAIKGTKYKNYKLVEGKSNRKFIDDDKAASIIKEAGFNPYITKLDSMTNLTKLMGKKKFEELLKSQIIKPKGKPTLVHRTDKREELIINSAQEDFKDIDD